MGEACVRFCITVSAVITQENSLGSPPAPAHPGSSTGISRAVSLAHLLPAHRPDARRAVLCTSRTHMQAVGKRRA